MDKVETKEIQETLIIHNFYCDDCNKFIKKVEESYDGYVPTYDIDYRIHYHVNGKWFMMNKHLCSECREKQNLKIEEGLLALGFKKEGEN